MEKPNPYRPDNPAITDSINYRLHRRRMLAGVGVLLLAISAVLFVFAPRITMYTPYATTTTWFTSSIDDSYYTITTPLQVWASLACGLCGMLMLGVALVLRTSKPDALHDNSS